MTLQEAFGLEVSKGLIAKVLMATTGFIGVIVFARELGPEGYGSFAVIVAAANIIDNPISGVAEACKKRISEHDRGRGEILGAGFLLSGFLLAVTVPLIFLIGPLTNTVAIESGYLYLAVLFTALVAFKTVHPLVSGIGEFGTAIVIDGVRSVVTLVLQVTFIFLLSWSVAGLVYGLAVATLLTVPVSLRVINARPRLPSSDLLADIWSYARFSIPTQFLGAAYNRVDILLIATVLASGAAGQYRVAMQLTLPGLFLSSVIGAGMFAEVSSIRSKGESATQRVTEGIAFSSLFSIPIFFGALAMPESIVTTVFGREYSSAAPLLIGLSLFQLFNTQVGPLSSVIGGIDRPDLNLKIKTVTLMINLTLGIALLYQIGILGVVIGTVVASAINYGFYTYVVWQNVEYKLLPEPLRAELLAGLVMFLIVELVHRAVGVASVYDLAALVGLGAVVYGIGLIALSDVFVVTARNVYADARERYL